MDKIDLRKSPESLETVRKQVIRLARQGKTHQEIADVTGASKRAVGSWIRAHRDEGAEALKPKTRGRKLGQKRSLSPEQEAEIRTGIAEKTPDQCKLNFALWTRQAVAELIRQRTGIDMPIRTVGLYLQRWGYTPQRPLKRAYEQRPAEVDHWLAETYPAIKAKAKRENAEIYWADETAVQTNDNRGRGYAPKGKTPTIRVTTRHTSVSMISAVTNEGKLNFMVLNKPMNAQLMIDFMKRLIKQSKRKVFLIVDNLKVHHARVVKAWLTDHIQEIEVFYLPSYSPELNPDEYLNGEIKTVVHSRPPAHSKTHLLATVLSVLRRLQKLPRHVANYFRHPKVAYAA